MLLRRILSNSMKLNIMKRVCLFLLVLLMGCSNSTSVIEIPDNIPKFPSFVSGLRISQASDMSQYLCTLVMLRDLWEEHTDPKQLVDHVVYKTKIFVDYEELSVNYLIYDRIHTVFNSESEPIGYYGGPIEICFDLETLSNGNHIVQLETTSLLGKQFDFVAYFRMNNDDIEILSG